MSTDPPIATDDVDEARDEVGSRAVFEILAAQNADMLACFLRTLVPCSEVDDLFQETFVTAWEKLPQFDRTRPFGPWLRGIAANKVRHSRDRRSSDRLRCDSAVLAAVEDSFAALPVQRGFGEVVDTLLVCLNQLPDKLRLAIELVYRKGLRMRRAAQRLEASEEAVKKRVQRGRQLLAECMRNERNLA